MSFCHGPPPPQSAVRPPSLTRAHLHPSGAARRSYRNRRLPIHRSQIQPQPLGYACQPRFYILTKRSLCNVPPASASPASPFAAIGSSRVTSSVRYTNRASPEQIQHLARYTERCACPSRSLGARPRGRAGSGRAAGRKTDDVTAGGGWRRLGRGRAGMQATYTSMKIRNLGNQKMKSNARMAK